MFRTLLRRSVFPQSFLSSGRSRSRRRARLPLQLETLEDRLTPSIDLVVSQVATPTPATAGSQLTYTLTVTNNGPDNATGVTLTDMLPTAVNYLSSTTSQGTITAPGTGATNSFDGDVYYTLNSSKNRL